MSATSAFLWAAAVGWPSACWTMPRSPLLPRRRRRFDLTDPAYLLKFFGHPLAGGRPAAAYAASRPEATPLVAVILGAAAPGIWRTIVRSGAAIGRLLLGPPLPPSGVRPGSDPNPTPLSGRMAAARRTPDAHPDFADARMVGRRWPQVC